MRIAIVTDAWAPQTNGVVRTLNTTFAQLEARGHVISVVHPGLFGNFPCPSYPEIRLAWLPGRLLAKLLDGFRPNAVHIATEGPLGMAARRWCLRHARSFTTSYHTQFPEYIRARAPIPLALSYAHLRRFHNAAARVMVATPSLERQLHARGFKNLVRWSRGVDVDLFRPGPLDFLDYPRPIFAYVGRVAVEKNIEDFLRLALPGTKLVIGDGPARKPLEAKYRDAVFVGYKYGTELAQYVAACDAFVFPSRTDTFGLVLLEAMACGVPVAAYPVTGPIDVVQEGVSGVLDNDLKAAALAALQLDRAACRRHALEYTWDKATTQFLGNLASGDAAAEEPATVSV